MIDADSSSLPLEVLGLFRIIFKSAGKHFEEIEKSVGVSGAQLWALSEIANAENLTVNGLAKAMSLHQSTTSNLLEKLESRGLVVKLRSTQDRRVVVLQATSSGQAALAQAPGPLRGILPDALMRMGRDELMTLKHHLEVLLLLLERKSERASGEPLGVAQRNRRSMQGDA